MSGSEAERLLDRQTFDALLDEVRPKLHRFCSRMVGSVIEGEDVVQEAMAKAVVAFPKSGQIRNPQAWIFRIAHNVALDVLRRRTRLELAMSDVDPESLVDPSDDIDSRELAAMSLRTFMRLPLVQRSAVLLMDVLGYSLRDVSDVMGSSVPAVKSALSRGRTRLREYAHEPDDAPVPVLPEPERSLLNAYVERFNARDFDAIRNMIADEVRLEVVSAARLNGRAEASTYFGNYTRLEGWRFSPGLVEGRPAALGHIDADPSGGIAYFVLIEWKDKKIIMIRDFLHARYAAQGAECVELDRCTSEGKRLHSKKERSG